MIAYIICALIAIYCSWSNLRRAIALNKESLALANTIAIKHREMMRLQKEINAALEMLEDERAGETFHFLYEDDPREDDES